MKIKIELSDADPFLIRDYWLAIKGYLRTKAHNEKIKIRIEII